ncbi:MAG: ACT domain-containing protein [Rhodospirillales bacterium]
MTKTLILTFIADDRPGLVERISQTVADAGGNWLDSRMAHLAAKFAGIAEIKIEEDKIAALEANLQALDAEGFHLVVEEADADATAAGAVYNIDLIGPDHPGIVRDISHFLAERGVSVEDMDTDIREAPHSGGTLFHARVRARAPETLGDADLRDSLESLADRLMVDITVGKIL